jgi:hypothetical protein
MTYTQLFYEAFREACRDFSKEAQPRQDHNLQSMARIKSKINMILGEGLTEQEIREKIKALNAGIARSIAFCGTTHFCRNRIARVNKLQHYLDTRY